MIIPAPHSFHSFYPAHYQSQENQLKLVSSLRFPEYTFIVTNLTNIPKTLRLLEHFMLVPIKHWDHNTPPCSAANIYGGPLCNGTHSVLSSRQLFSSCSRFTRIQITSPQVTPYITQTQDMVALIPIVTNLTNNAKSPKALRMSQAKLFKPLGSFFFLIGKVMNFIAKDGRIQLRRSYRNTRESQFNIKSANWDQNIHILKPISLPPQ